MTEDEAQEFVKYVDGAWRPDLTDVEKDIWRKLCLPLDAKVAFTVLLRLTTSEKFRPSRPDYMTVYKRELIDRTPIQPLTPTDRDEMPEWVRGWKLAHLEGDTRLWPEMEKGAREIHEAWLESVGPAFAKKHGLHSGYEWEADVAERGIMPQADRLQYIQRSQMTQEEVLDGIMGG